MRFLVVDDSSTMRRIIINALGKIGYSDCLEARHGREGLERLSSSQVDVILTDWNMPEMNGLEFVRAVRAQHATRNVPIVMVTTNAAKDDIVEALRAGVTNYVVKPFTPEVIQEKIQAAVKGEPTSV
jgi:two-component system, chemotaxis family, chemotaxis protein CheY